MKEVEDQSVILLGVGGGVRQIQFKIMFLFCKENIWTIHTHYMNTTLKDDTVTTGQLCTHRQTKYGDCT